MEITAPAPESRVPLDGVDLTDPGRYRDACQHTLWQTMRKEAPAWLRHTWDGTPFWNFSLHRDVEQVVVDAGTFSSAHGTILASVGVGDPAGDRTITLMDPPSHSRIRRPSMKAIGQGTVRRNTEHIREGVRRTVAPMLEGGEHDAATLLRRLPMAIVGGFMGVPERFWDKIAYYSMASIAPEDPEFARGRSTTHTLRHAHHELFSCFGELISQRRAEPGDDLISALISLETDEGRMDDMRVLLNCYSFVLGANTTTPHVAGHILWHLARRPQLWERVRDDPSLIAPLVDEGARWASPTHHLVRRATAPATVGGVDVAEGDWVCAWVASANRDEDVFDAPYEFRLDRAPNPHLGFGVGPHYCIGAPSSRSALTMMFEELFEHIDSISAPGPVRHLYSNWINGLTSLPLRTVARGR